MPTSLVSEVKTQSIDRFKDMRKLKDFDILRKLGKGTFGIVQKARYIKTGQVVALKQLINHSAKEGFPITAMREITIVKSLNHENILKILDMIYEEPKVTNPQELIHTRGCFHTVSPYMTSDLVGLLENPNIVLTLSQIKCFMQQLLTGIQYIHEKKYLHRDIKAANILIDENGVLKIADFGLARIYHGTAPTLGNGPGGGERLYTGLVVTRWYRPPEILLGERKYTTAVDIWGVGCVFGEFFTGKPILSGRSDSHQCQIVFQMVGPPKSDDWPDINTLPNKTDINIGLTCKRSLEEKFMTLMNDALVVDLLSKMLTLNPYKRCNALDALNHPFFKSDPLPDKPHELPKFEECHEIDKERFQKMAKNKGLINVSQETTSTISSTSMKDLKTPGAPLPNQGGTNNSLPNSKRNNNFAANYSDSGFRPESNRDLSRSASEGTESNVWGTNNDANSDTSSFKSNLEEVNKSNTLNHTSDVQQSGNKEADHGNNVNKLEVLSSIDKKPTMTEQKATTNVVKELTPLNSTRLPSRDNVKPPTSSIFMPKNKKRPAPPPSAVISSKKKVIKPLELDGSNAIPTKLIPLSNTTPKFNPITKTKQDNLHSRTHSGAEDDDLSEYEDEVPNKYIINKVGLEDYQKLFK